MLNIRPRRVYCANFLAFAVLLIVFAQPRASAQNNVYALTKSGDFGTLSLGNGTFTKLGNTGTKLAGLAELGANLFGGAYGGSTLYQVSLKDGSLTGLGFNLTMTYLSMGATTGALYAIGTDLNLYYVVHGVENDLHVVLRGATGLPTGTTAMSANGSVLYATVDSGSGSILYSLNTNTGAATPIGNTGLAKIDSLVYRDNALYAAPDNGTLYTLNTNNGTATFVANTNIMAQGMALPASTFTPLYEFTGGADGGSPLAGLIMDRNGNLYGTANIGAIHGGNCPYGCGTVFELTPQGQNWIFSTLYSFMGGTDGYGPQAPVILGSDGKLYGTTAYMGAPGNQG